MLRKLDFVHFKKQQLKWKLYFFPSVDLLDAYQLILIYFVDIKVLKWSNFVCSKNSQFSLTFRNATFCVHKYLIIQLQFIKILECILYMSKQNIFWACVFKLIIIDSIYNWLCVPSATKMSLPQQLLEF